MGTSRKQTRTRTGKSPRPTTSRRRAGTATAHRGTRSRLARTLVDHEEIRRWAEERGGKPTAVKGTSRGRDDIGMIRIDFPGYSGEGKLEPIDWEEWFAKFDESNLALVVQDKTAHGEVSHFNKLVAREGSPRRRPRAGTRMQARAQQ
jgi:hypothetical protein